MNLIGTWEKLKTPLVSYPRGLNGSSVRRDAYTAHLRSGDHQEYLHVPTGPDPLGVTNYFAAIMSEIHDYLLFHITLRVETTTLNSGKPPTASRRQAAPANAGEVSLSLPLAGSLPL